MYIRILSRREPWMTQPEWRHALRYRRALLQHLEGRAIPITPFVAMRLQDFLVMLTLTRRMELAFLPGEGEDAPCPVPTLAQLEEIAAARDRVARLLAEIVGETDCDEALFTAADSGQPTPHPGHTGDAAHEPIEYVEAEHQMDAQLDPMQALLMRPEYGEPTQSGPVPTSQTDTPLNRRQRRALARLAA